MKPRQESSPKISLGSSLRFRVLLVVGAVVGLAVVISAVTLARVSEVKTTLDGINQHAIPLNRLLGQLQNDVDLLSREAERALGAEHWADPHWKARGLPQWVTEVLTHETARLAALSNQSHLSAERKHWAGQLVADLQAVFANAQALEQLLDQTPAVDRNRLARDAQIRFSDALSQFTRSVEWGVRAQDQEMRTLFADSERRVADLRTGLELSLVAVIVLSVLLLWLGERALRPLSHLTRLAREITRRGLRREDRAAWLAAAGVSATTAVKDEVGTLAQEFQRMTTALLERERVVESQNQRLEAQNAELLELGRLRERLQAAESLAAVGRLSAQVAHEVRNPLHAIGLEAELALDRLSQSKGLAPAQVRESLLSIMQGVDRLERITENYLRLSRGKSETPAKELRADLVESLEATLALYASEFQAHRVRVQWHLPKNPVRNWWVRAESELLEQSLGNLIRNALQSLRENAVAEPEVRFQLSQHGDGEAALARLEIWDNGPGIAPENVARLFEPFVTTRAQGTGLGLSFVSQVAAGWGGRVYLAEARPARFVLELQAWQMAAPTLAQKTQSEKGAEHANPDLIGG